MKRKLRNFLGVCALLMFIATISPAQSPDFKNAMSFKYLSINYQEDLPFDQAFNNFRDNTAGVEIAYLRNLAKPLNLAIPFKMGVADLPTAAGGLDKSNFFLSLDALFHLTYFKNKNIFVPYLLAGVGATYIDKSFGDTELNPQVPLGAGLNIKVTQNFYIQLQYEYRLAFEDFRDHEHLGLGFQWLMGNPPPPDKDGDGVTDDVDNCPDTPGLAALKGCPDRDGDGITDKADNCPDVAGIATFNGCPDTDEDGLMDSEDDCPEEAGPKSNKGCPIADTDGDGLKDDVDNCPNEVGPASNNGCPIADTDGDGLKDDVDDCPNQAGPASNKGCPIPDTDGDGVKDDVDKCPTTKGPASNSGCPEIKEEDKEVLKFAMKSVQFNTAQATLKSVSLPVLDEVAGIMNKYPDYSLSISGHTDSVGDEASNQLLSERRAKTCYDYLVSKGVDPKRMSYVGYGETQPIADNKYKDGRETNRRVEFNIHLK